MQGLNDVTKSMADSLADAGFTAPAPDLFGSVPVDDAAGQALLGEVDADGIAALVIASVVALRSQCDDPSAPVGWWASHREDRWPCGWPLATPTPSPQWSPITALRTSISRRSTPGVGPLRRI
nr:hypothetical protein [Candidatus Microthrix sp.]